jgi:hypothetical protein
MITNEPTSMARKTYIKAWKIKTITMELIAFAATMVCDPLNRKLMPLFVSSASVGNMNE